MKLLTQLAKLSNLMYGISGGPKATQLVRLRRLLIEQMEERRLLTSIDLAALSAEQGLVIYGADVGDQSGRSVSSTGDVNGDGFDDFVIGARYADASGNAKLNAGESYLIFGAASLPTTIDSNNLGTAGVTIFGADTGDQSGISVSNAGDVNGDGFDDFVIGARRGAASGNLKASAGESYLIFGAMSFPASIDLANLGSAGVTLYGADAFDQSGSSVSSAGDVNGDGFDDLIIGAYYADASGNAKLYAGESYLIFGAASLPTTIDLSRLSTTRAGITIFGVDAGDNSGKSVSSAGDVNGDGFDDLVIGAYAADASGNSRRNTGESYLIFGAASLPTTINLANLGSAGVTLFGVREGDFNGASVSNAGDVNGDGLDDFVIGAYLADGPLGNSRFAAGESYLIFGARPFPSSINLASMGSAGITILGAEEADISGFSVSSAGDVNGDGFDDLMALAGADALGNAKSNAGESYLIFGAPSLPATIDLASLTSAGITIFGADIGDNVGFSVSSAGDVNGDGLDDLLIGANRADASGNAKSDAGESYLIYGSNSFTNSILPANFGTSAAETITGTVGAEILNGADGNDILLGNGGVDVLLGGRGDDILAVSDLSFQRIVGGNGSDTLRLDGSDMTLDLTTIFDNRIVGIEVIDITGSGNNTLILTAQDVLALSDNSNTLMVRGNAGDRISFGDWAEGVNETIGSDTFRVFTQGAATLKVSLPLSTQITSIDLANLGSTSTTLFGVDANDSSGNALSSVGDVNGDGFDDFVIASSNADASGNAKLNAGESYLIFGAASLPATIDLANLGSAGVTLFGADANDVSGISIRGAGDVNGDGFDDLLIGARGADASGNTKLNAGESYLIFGAASLPETIELTNLGSAGTTIFGADVIDYSGTSVSGAAGDVNGDGFDDFIVGAYRADGAGNERPYAGESYLIFGAASLPATIDLANLGSAGITLFGAGAADLSGSAASSAGDVNGDGFDDFIIGAYRAAAAGNAKSTAGESYLIFGAASLPVTIDLANLGSAGITIFGAVAGDASGSSVSSTGDVNGDGFDDFVIGAFRARQSTGESYLIFGAASLPATIDLANLGSAGITILGADRLDMSGFSVSGAGDFNGDGFDDFLIGALGGDASADAKMSAGESYLIFGAAALPATIDLTHLNSIGIVIVGAEANDQSGRSVSSAGDVNGDGFDDIVIGADGADASGNAKIDAGESYLIFGGNDFTSSILPANLGNSAANTITGTSAADILSGADGDDWLIGDGGADVLLGGRGDDILAVADMNFRRIVGGAGVDTLRLDGGGITLDLTAIADNRIVDVEQIDIAGSGDNTLVLDYQEVLNISSTSNTLIVRRDVGDVVTRGSGWTQVADELIEGDTFEVYRQGAATLKLHRLAHTFALPAGNGLDVLRLQRNGSEIELYDDGVLLDTIRLPLLGSLTLQAATAEANRFEIDYASGGFFVVPDGITFTGSSETDDLRIIGDGNNFATIVSSGPLLTNGSLLISEGGPTTSITFTGIEPLSLSGMLMVDVDGLLGVGTQTLSIDAATFTQLGSATTLTGGTINAPSGLHLGAAKVLQASGTINAPVTSDLGSTITLTGDLTIGAEFDGINLAGRLNIGGNTATLLDGHMAVLGSHTTIGSSSAGGTLNSTFGVELPNSRTFVGRGTINTSNGHFGNQGFVQGNDAGLTFNHPVTGRGNFGGTVEFLGGFSPGNGPAKITAENIAFGPLNAYQAEVGGLVAGNTFDQLSASRVVVLDGTLEVVFLNLGNGFTPAVGQSFDIITAGSITGTFANVSLPTLPDELSWNIVYHADRVTLIIEANIAPEFSIAPSVSLNEGNSGTSNFEFVVTRAGLTNSSTTLDYTFAAGDTSADDFVGGVFPGNGQVSFANGQTSAVISIAVNGDTVLEADESFSILISNPSVGSILAGQDTAVGTIVNDDVQDTVAPTVARALIAASNWSAAFIDDVGGSGDNGLGFELLAGGLPLPWSGVNRLYVQFSEDVVGISAATIELRNSTGLLPITVAYDPLTFRAEVSLVTPLVFSKLRLAVADSVRDAAGNQLDGDSSGAGGGLFNLRFDVLAGDSDGSGRVNGADLAAFSTAFNSQVSQPNYNPRANWNGDDRINGADLGVFSAAFNRQLSSLTEPTAPFGGSGGTGSWAVPHDDFFGVFGQDDDDEEEEVVEGVLLSDVR